ncbi:PIN domain-containing protein [Gryllotalpicola protaetiae]|uniref:PIN domain-containing protein n=1 Tax=Gryllotalpicola protaetiae TaxID=2419771 RepID=A0A387BMJ9_9MICO|nr:PIN domain-containing protein [Gryllotalpicola protaetiae]AYG03254.1 PIN domain-containing protein [Gryllotalpicola protaetiae]
MILLDTSILISARQTLNRWGDTPPDETAVFSILSYAELAFGIAAATDRDTRAGRQENLTWIESLAPNWLSFDRRAADGYAAVAAAVRPTRPAHARSKDIMLAGQAYALGASLATLNPKDFELVSHLVKIVAPE